MEKGLVWAESCCMEWHTGLQAAARTTLKLSISFCSTYEAVWIWI